MSLTLEESRKLVEFNLNCKCPKCEKSSLKIQELPNTNDTNNTEFNSWKLFCLNCDWQEIV